MKVFIACIALCVISTMAHKHDETKVKAMKPKNMTTDIETKETVVTTKTVSKKLMKMNPSVKDVKKIRMNHRQSARVESTWMEWSASTKEDVKEPRMRLTTETTNENLTCNQVWSTCMSRWLKVLWCTGKWVMCINDVVV